MQLSKHRWPRVTVLRYVLIALAASLGTWFYNIWVAVAAVVICVVLAPYLAHPVDSFRLMRRRMWVRAFLTRMTSNQRTSAAQISAAPEQVARALEGKVHPFRVFISSTFSDLVEEREILSQEVFPRLAHECERRGAVWAPIDLRWGITEMQQRAGEVIQICLDSVERSRPNTIGIIGSRYGTHLPFSTRDREVLPDWVTNSQGLSVTHLELRHAQHANPTDLSVFVMDREVGDADRGNVISLVSELREHGAHVVQGIPDARQLADHVHAELIRRLDRQVPMQNLDNLLLQEISSHVATEMRLGERPLLNAPVIEAVNDSLKDQVCAILRGAPGSGRSTLLAQWAQRWRQAHPEDVVITRFVGLTEDSQSIAGLLRSIVAEISLRTGHYLRLPEGDDGSMVASYVVYQMQRLGHRIVLAIDGLDHLRSRHDLEARIATSLGWLPQSGKAVRLEFVPILATTGLIDEGDFAYPTRAVTVPELGRPDRMHLVDASLASVDRVLPLGERIALVEHPKASDPTFLGLLLDDLHKTSSHAQLRPRLTELTATSSLPELVELALTRIELEIGIELSDYLHDLLALLSTSRSGFSETEIVGVLSAVHPGFTQTELSLLRWRLSSLLLEEQGLLGMRSPYDRHLRNRISEASDGSLKAARFTYFADPARRMTPRALRELTALGTPDAKSLLREIAVDPVGLTALRHSLDAGYQELLGVLADQFSTRVHALLTQVARTASEIEDPAARLAVVQCCADYGLFELSALCLPDLTDSGDTQWRDDLLAMRGRLSQLGLVTVREDEWDVVLQTADQRPATAARAIFNLGMMTFRRGDHYWAEKYVALAADLAMENGEAGLVGKTSLNYLLLSLENSFQTPENSFQTPFGPTIATLFEELARIGGVSGDYRLLLDGLFRRGFAELAMNRNLPQALDSFEAVEESAAELGHDRLTELALMGRALTLHRLGRLQDAERLSRSNGKSFEEMAQIVAKAALSFYA